MITLTDKMKCSGCFACEQVCPVGAISMKQDKEGFLIPVIEESICISCKKCIKSCPAENPLPGIEPMGIYAAKAKDEKLVNRSSSGGLFGTLAKDILAEGGIVFGAGYDREFNVVHKSVENTEDLYQLMGSKYVQSELRDTYKEVENALSGGRQVLFSGTPCQCAALRAYLGKEYANLLLLDFICHGVASPEVYRNYLRYMSEEDEIISVCFRDKSTDKTGAHIRIDYKNKQSYTQPFAKDLYMMAFLQDIDLRNSCYNCMHKNFTSGSDITIGDYWGIDITQSILKDEKGVSLVIVNTEKGKNRFDKVSGMLTFDESNLEDVLKANMALIRSVRRNPLRDKYLKDAKRLNIKKLADKYCGSSYTAKLRRLIARCRKDR